MRDVRTSVGKALISREETAPVFEVGSDGGVLIGELTVLTGGVLALKPRPLGALPSARPSDLCKPN